MALQTHPIHKSMHRPNLFMGVDRTGALAVLLVTGDLVLIGMTMISFITAGLVWVVGFWGLRLMAKADPQMREVYMRYIGYKKLMPASSTPSRKNVPSQTNHYKTGI